jgi:hypothetical protein
MLIDFGCSLERVVDYSFYGGFSGINFLAYTVNCKIQGEAEDSMNPENREIGSWKAIINKIKEKFIKEDFLSLERTGDKTLVVFVGEPFAYEAVWELSNGCTEKRLTLYRITLSSNILGQY